MNKYLFFIILISLLLQSCDKEPSSKKEIGNKITQLYASSETIYDQEPDTTLFTSEIMVLIENARKITAGDQERIKNSPSPTDKPLILEGNIFCSFYEGFTKYTIKDISIIDTTAKVIIDFEYDSKQKETWTDTIVLKKDQNWKIDNILYSKKYTTYKDLKEILDFKNKSS